LQKEYYSRVLVRITRQLHRQRSSQTCAAAKKSTPSDWGKSTEEISAETSIKGQMQQVNISAVNEK